LELPVNYATVNDLQQLFYKNLPKYYPERQRLSIGTGSERRVLQKDKALSDYGITGDRVNVVEFRDLGAQVSWRTVYLSEYIGPFLLYLWTYYQPEILYGSHHAPTYYQKLACYCFLGHFGRRLFESAFVHKWSGDSLGIYFLIKNCAYYWSAGFLIGYVTNHPTWVPIIANDFVIKAEVALFVIFQVANMWIHLQLRFARAEDSSYRWLPKGFLWSITGVSFPNYFFEVLIWIAWNIAFFSIPGVLFLIAGTVQMGIWAAKKHSNYRKIFDGKDGRPAYPRHRRAMIPFIF
jgi:very-long-chain enoyl-CoA reductase